jgi:hypothetical protein
VYVASYYVSSISVLRDSTVGVAEGPKPQAICLKSAAAVVSGVLRLPVFPLTIHTSLFDLTGRQVMALHLGPNDVRALAPGVYFVREQSAVSSQHSGTSSVRRIVVTR